MRMYRMEPVAITAVPSGLGVSKQFLESLCHRAALAAADWPSIHLAYRRDFDGGAGKESFIALQQAIKREGLCFNLPSQIAGELEHAVASNPEQNGIAFTIGHEVSILHQEDIFTRALGYIAVQVQQQGFIKSTLNRILNGKNRVH